MRRALLAFVAFVAASAAPVQASTADVRTTAPPPQVAASAWYLVGEDGKLLARRNDRQQRPIASITKLMTALVVIERARLSDVVTVTPYAADPLESVVYLRAGEELTVAELLRAMLIPSANDAAHMLALHVGEGSIERFVDLMNAKAKELGLEDTRFENPIGLDEVGHVSSARDATALVRYALGIPFIENALARETYTSPAGRVFPTTDDLLSSWAPLVRGRRREQGRRDRVRHGSRERVPQRAERLPEGAPELRAQPLRARAGDLPRPCVRTRRDGVRPS
jgi:D-alanyl-D-alanine carboxypeptidase (penicillin-binding protein 5/6)